MMNRFPVIGLIKINRIDADAVVFHIFWLSTSRTLMLGQLHERRQQVAGPWSMQCDRGTRAAPLN